MGRLRESWTGASRLRVGFAKASRHVLGFSWSMQDAFFSHPSSSWLIQTNDWILHHLEIPQLQQYLSAWGIWGMHI